MLRDELLRANLTPYDIVTTLDDKIGEFWRYCEPETLWLEIEERSGLEGSLLVFEDIPRSVKNKIMATRLCLNSYAPWQDWAVFGNVCAALNGVSPDPENFVASPPSAIARCVYFMYNLDASRVFDEDVRALIAAQMVNEGILWLPGLLGDIANDAIRIIYCKRMGVNPEDNNEVDDKIIDLILAYFKSKEYEYDPAELEGAEAVHTVKLLALDQALANSSYWPQGATAGA